MHLLTVADKGCFISEIKKTNTPNAVLGELFSHFLKSEPKDESKLINRPSDKLVCM